MKKISPLKINKIGLTTFITIIILIIVVSFVKLPEKEKTLYCHFTDNESISPLYRCGIMKVITKDIDHLNIGELTSLNITSITCSEELDELDTCPENSLYYLYYPLKTFCEDPECDVEGDLCFKYSVEYYTNNTEFIEYYEAMFMQHKFNNSEEWNLAFDTCGRIGDLYG